MSQYAAYSVLFKIVFHCTGRDRAWKWPTWHPHNTPGSWRLESCWVWGTILVHLLQFQSVGSFWKKLDICLPIFILSQYPIFGSSILFGKARDPGGFQLAAVFGVLFCISSYQNITLWYQILMEEDLAKNSQVPWYQPLDPNHISLSTLKLTPIGRFFTHNMVWCTLKSYVCLCSLNWGNTYSVSLMNRTYSIVHSKFSMWLFNYCFFALVDDVFLAVHPWTRRCVLWKPWRLLQREVLESALSWSRVCSDWSTVAGTSLNPNTWMCITICVYSTTNVNYNLVEFSHFRWLTLLLSAWLQSGSVHTDVLLSCAETYWLQSNCCRVILAEQQDVW